MNEVLEQDENMQPLLDLIAGTLLPYLSANHAQESASIKQECCCSFDFHNSFIHPSSSNLAFSYRPELCGQTKRLLDRLNRVGSPQGPLLRFIESQELLHNDPVL
jgi:hypothetical protein